MKRRMTSFCACLALCTMNAVSLGAQPPDKPVNWPDTVRNIQNACTANWERGRKLAEDLIKNEAAPPEYRAAMLIFLSGRNFGADAKQYTPPFLAQAEALVPDITTPEAQAGVFLGVAAQYFWIGDKTKTIARLKEAGAATAKVTDPSAKLALLVRLADQCGKAGLRDEAAAYSAQMEEAAMHVESKSDRLAGLLKVAESHFASRNADVLLRVATAAESLCAEAKDTANQAKCSLWLGAALEWQKKYAESAVAYRKAAGPLGGWWPSASAARCLAATGQTGEALKLLKEATLNFPDLLPGAGTAATAAGSDGYLTAVLQISADLRDQKKLEPCIFLLRTATCFPGRTAKFADKVAEAQAALVIALLAEGKAELAIPEAKRYFMLCRIQDLGRGIDAVARVFKAADMDINRRAKDFLDYQRMGPAGKDGKKGTGDDLQNPLAKVATPAPPEYELLDSVLAGLDPTDHRARAYVHLVKGEADMALTEFRCAYAIANGANVTDAIYDVATGIKAVDGHVLRANQYLMFQKRGPAGEDGKLGTEDDLRDPLEGVSWVLPKERLKTLEAQIEKCAKDYQGTRRRGYLLLSCGRADEGLKVMRDAYAQSGIDAADLQTAIMDLAAALKAVDSHIFRANQYLLYEKFGPAGPDGVKGTPDDLENPLDAKAPNPAAVLVPRNGG